MNPKKRTRPSGVPLERVWYLLSMPMLAFIILPIAALLLRVTPSQLALNLAQPQVHQAVQLSLITSLASTLITLIAGTPVAYLLAQPRFALRQAVDTIIDLPTVLPPSVAGVALLLAFGRRGLFGSWFEQAGISIPFTPLAVILAQTFVAAPFYIKSAVLGFSAVGSDLKQAASLDGANTWQIFRYIVLPLSWLPILTGGALTWARALGEFGATIIFAGNYPGRTQTMPLAIYLGFEIDLNVAISLSFILISLSFLILIVVKSLLKPHLPLDTDEY